MSPRPAASIWTVVMARGDRGECVTAMAKAAPRLLERLVAEGRIQGVIALGGGGGTAIASAAMRPLCRSGFPSSLVSTLASGNTAPYVGMSDHHDDASRRRRAGTQ
jgi:uncharacterized protein (UPF0261 family)